MMLITGASSFLSDALVRTLSQHNFNYLVVTDNNPAWRPPADWRIKEHLLPTPLPDWFERNQQEMEFAFCLDLTDDSTGDTYFRTLWQQCIDYQVPLIYRTTAARSFWVARQAATPFFWAGLLAPPPRTKSENDDGLLSYARDVAQAAYSLVHHRQQCGEFTVSDINQNHLRDKTGYSR